jgi:hypothetical protein
MWKYLERRCWNVRGRRDPQGCETSRLPHFLGIRLTDGSKVLSLMHRPPFTLPQEDSWYSFLLYSVSTPGPQCGWNDLIGNRNRYLPACSLVPERTTLPRAIGKMCPNRGTIRQITWWRKQRQAPKVSTLSHDRIIVSCIRRENLRSYVGAPHRNLKLQGGKLKTSRRIREWSRVAYRVRIMCVIV